MRFYCLRLIAGNLFSLALVFAAAGCYAWPYNTRPHTYFAELADLDGDGDLDAYLANGENEGVARDIVWFNDGKGSFADPAEQPYQAETHFAALGDLDGDGDLDVLTNRAIGLNDGKGWFRYQSQPSYPEDSGSYTFFPALGDLDGDGDLDAVMGGCCGAEISFGDERDPVSPPLYSYNLVWLNDGSAVFSDSGQKLGLDGTVSLAMGDLDSDGDLDVFEANASSITRGTDEAAKNQPDHVLWNNGHASLSDSGQRLGMEENYAAALGDLDGDGDLDALSGGRDASLVWMNDGRGRFSDSGQRLKIAGDPGKQEVRRVILRDLDGDSDLDAFCAGRGFAQAWMNDGAGRLTQGPSLKESIWAAFTLGDVDGDGDMDIFSGLLDDHAKVWFNDGRGNFSQP